ncbi:hypothetical protein AN217_17200 [Streptomyces qinglanensis]|uniref:Uncharacterized protein n=1 Tax=Streptomyces qinglanensis TaxID=943816 RepID=A0A1E7K5Q6_9ACTN|nr:hypothetical protein AN217_17200 [Streptomyces qinglanensis]OEV28370.1 hypothetical protein AN220_01950 [Streptomyces nanshensis]
MAAHERGDRGQTPSTGARRSLVPGQRIESEDGDEGSTSTHRRNAHAGENSRPLRARQPYQRTQPWSAAAVTSDGAHPDAL